MSVCSCVCGCFQRSFCAAAVVVCARARACVRAFVCVCVHLYVCVCARVSVAVVEEGVTDTCV